jgi:hypothetical protein
MPDITVRAIQKINKNIRGTVIGFKADNVYGNVTNVNVFALPPDADPTALWDTLLAMKKGKPYKFIEPYTAYDEQVFKGRSDEVTSVLDTIIRQQQVVIYGQAGVGKTSLMAAGLIPKLLKLGVLTIQIQDYAAPVDSIRQALRTHNENIEVELTKEMSLVQMVDAITLATGGTLFLIFDQFELLFDPSIDSARRESLVAALQDLLNAQPPKPVRVIILVREDAMGKLADMQTQLPELLKSPFMLLPLTFATAIEAIKEPLKATDYPVSFAPDSIVDDRIVPDLVEISKSTVKGVHPPYLQIVCSDLYERAHLLHPPQIDTELYGQGAESIIAGYLQKLLHTQLEDIRVVASEVLSLMASPGMGQWVSIQQLQLKGVAPAEMETKVTELLKRLMSAKLVISRIEGSQPSYAFANPTLKELARKLDNAAPRRQAGYELERIWATWLSRNILASREQLRYLEESGTHLTPRSLEALFLLRSAAEREEPTSRWLDWVKADKERALIWQLEGRSVPKDLESSSLTTVQNAGLLLDLETNGANGTPAVDEDVAYGVLAKSAVTHANPAVRQTSALALTVSGRHEALNQLNNALQDKDLKVRRRRWRRAELLGALAEADPKIEELNAKLKYRLRFPIWLWRTSRRVSRDRRRLAWYTLGAAVGAGVGMGLLRGGLTFLINIVKEMDPQNSLQTQRAGIQFGQYFYFAAIVGAFTGFGIAIAKPLSGSQVGGKREPAKTRDSARKAALLAVFTGAFFFGVGHALLMPINAIIFSETPWTFPLGFVAGLGLCLSLYAQPRAGTQLRVREWLLRLTGAALTFVLIQLVFNIVTGANTGIAIAWTGGFYEGNLRLPGLTWWKPFMEGFPCPASREGKRLYSCWADYLGLLDAAMVGIILFIAMTFGLALSRKYLNRHRVEAEYLGE